MPGSSRLPLWWVRPLLLLLSLGAGLLGGEILLRVFFPQPLLSVPPLFMPAGGGQHFQLRPDLDVRVETLDGGYTVRTSPGGNRGRDPAGRPPAGVHRIVFFGDSFCFGNGVEEEESIAHQVGVLLKERAGLGGTCEVFNIGQPAYSLPQSASRLEAWIAEWGAQEVVLLLYVGNDFHDGHPDDLATLWVDEAGNVRGDTPSARPDLWQRWSISVRGWLLRNSMLFSLVRLAISDLREPNHAPVELYRAGYPTGNKVLVDMVRTSLERMNSTCRRHGAELRVAALPDLMQADEGWWEGFARRFEETEQGTYDRWAPQGWLEATCDSLDIAYVDLAPVLLERGRTAFLRTDRHLTPVACRAVAEELVPSLGR